MTGRGRPHHNRDDDDPLDIAPQPLDDAALDASDDQAPDPGEELRDPLDGVLTSQGVSNPAIGVRVVFIDRQRRTLVFSSMVDFIRTARSLAADGVELYE